MDLLLDIVHVLPLEQSLRRLSPLLISQLSNCWHCEPISLPNHSPHFSFDIPISFHLLGLLLDLSPDLLIRNHGIMEHLEFLGEPLIRVHLGLLLIFLQHLILQIINVLGLKHFLLRVRDVSGRVESVEDVGIAVGDHLSEGRKFLVSFVEGLVLVVGVLKVFEGAELFHFLLYLVLPLDFIFLAL